MAAKHAYILCYLLLKVLKRVVSFPRFSYPRADDTPNRFDDVTIATGTTLDSGLPAHVVDRYTVTRISRDHDQPSEGIAVHVRGTALILALF